MTLPAPTHLATPPICSYLQIEPTASSALQPTPTPLVICLILRRDPSAPHPRIDTSEHVWFANDQLAVRFLEEIDFDYAAIDATAALLTAKPSL